MSLPLLATVSGFSLLVRFVRKVFPLVNRELYHWQQYAAAHGIPELSSQALASIRTKKFHCQGGSVYSLYPGVSTAGFVRLVVALQTISDYLDNLCDRAGIADETAFRQLHLAMTDALDPARPLHDYYATYPYKDDGGYLSALVTACRAEVAKLPAYHLVKQEALRQAGLYSQLQTYKHLDRKPGTKAAKLDQALLPSCPGITAWEFAAATGSTLGLFMFCAAAGNPQLTAREAAVIG